MCSQESSEHMPPRLLDVMNGNADIVRLIELRLPPGAAPKYAYLSHCWGKTKSHIPLESRLWTTTSVVY
jgi:hypothetical protein